MPSPVFSPILPTAYTPLQEAATVREKLSHEAYMKERSLFMHDPHPATATQGRGLPPNAGTMRAMAQWEKLGGGATGGGHGHGSGSDGARSDTGGKGEEPGAQAYTGGIGNRAMCAYL